MKKTRIIISLILAAALIFCSACGARQNPEVQNDAAEEAERQGKSVIKEIKPASAAKPTYEPEPEAEPEPKSELQPEPKPEPEPEPEPEPKEKAPPALPYDIKTAVELAGGSKNSVKGTQLITVAATGSEAIITAYEVDMDGAWTIYASEINGHVGKNGVSDSKKEGDKTTPAGIYDMKRAFGFNDMPDVKLAYTKINKNHYWVDDPASKYYNTLVETDTPDWKSAEHLIEYPSNYKMAIVIEYNTENTAVGKGSAIFLHCGERGTSGCVAADDAAIGKLIRWLDPECSPQIVIYNAG